MGSSQSSIKSIIAFDGLPAHGAEGADDYVGEQPFRLVGHR
jgi:hypothetical protein